MLPVNKHAKAVAVSFKVHDIVVVIELHVSSIVMFTLDAPPQEDCLLSAATVLSC